MQKIKELFEKRAVSLAVFILYPVLEFFINQYAMTDDLHKMLCKLIIVNILFYELFSFLLFFISGSGKLAARISLVFFWFTGVLNAYIYRFRGTFIRPWDIFSVKTAMNVAVNYDYRPDTRMITVTIAAVLLFLIAGFIKLDIKTFIKNRVIRIVLSLAAVLMICVSAFALRKDRVIDALGIYTTQFDSKGMIRSNGMFVSIMYQMKYLNVEKPEDYSADKEAEILSSYKYGKGCPAEKPDILVFMDEAFSDPAVDGEFETDTDYMPFIHSLEKGHENTITGYINTSVNGGNTPNSEFEFLTGNTMGFLPEGSIAYQQYVRHHIDSIPSMLKSFGYSTLASHPYKANGWDRPRVYPLLGFDEMLFDDHFESFSPERVRNYISDEADFNLVADRVDEMRSDGPVFSFNVTMQNHSGYSKKDYDNFERSVKLKDVDAESDATVRMENYLSLVKYTDTALKNIVERYSSADRPVMIVFFGDHQPDPATFDAMWDREQKNREALEEEDYYNTYRVPFVIWANFDIDEMSGVETSLNYLGNLVLEEAGFELPPYRSFLKDFEPEYPVISAIRYQDSNGDSVGNKDFGKELDEYRKLQYYMMFDKKQDKEPETAAPAYSFSYDWIKNGNIAHALGETVDGIKNTNCREAFIYNYEKGFRIFEADLIHAKDGTLIMGHRWDDILGKELYEKRGGDNSSAKMDWEELKEAGIQEKYTAMRLQDFAELLKDYPDAYVVLDTKQTKKEQFLQMYREVYEIIDAAAPGILPRIIPQVYSDAVLDELMEIYPWKSCIYSCYKTKEDKFPEHVAEYALNKGIGVITVDHNKESEEWNKYLNERKLTIYYNTINDEDQEKELKERGVYGLYSDCLVR